MPFDISRPIPQELVHRGKRYQLFLSFDNILRVFEMFQDDDIEDLSKPYFAMILLTGSQDFNDLYAEEVIEVYKQVFDEHIKVTRPIDEAPRYDLEGNVLPSRKTGDDEDEDRAPFSFKYDGEYIFASFLQAYGLDLIEQQGVLSWRKFNALLAGLPDNTKLSRVMEIRSWKPSDTKDKKERERMRKLQKIYELPKE